MNAAALFELLAAAKAECGHTDYVVVGSVSVLGMSEVSAIPAGMTMSIDADCYTLTDPPRVFDLQTSLGEGSPYHRLHGIYLDPVSPQLPTLPDGWRERLIPFTHGDVGAGVERTPLAAQRARSLPARRVGSEARESGNRMSVAQSAAGA